VSTVAALLDPELVEAIRNTGDNRRTEYTRLKRQLQKGPEFQLSQELKSATYTGLLSTIDNVSAVGITCMSEKPA
jgi:hypothetical protein